MRIDENGLTPSDMAKVPFLAELLPAEVEAMCAAGVVHQLDADEHVFRQGDDGTDLCVVIDGEVVIEIDISDGPPRQLAALTAGALFGEISFLLESERTASARCRVPTRLLSFKRAAVDELEGIGRQALSNVMEVLARVLALRLTRMDRELAEAYSQGGTEKATADERRAELLHHWSPSAKV